MERELKLVEKPVELKELAERKLILLININYIYNIIEKNIKKFINKITKPKYIPEKIKKRFLNKYKDFLYVVNLTDINIVPEYKSYNYKIEFKSGIESLLYFRARPILP